MKKAILIVLAILLVLSLAACDKKPADPSNTNGETNSGKVDAGKLPETITEQFLRDYPVAAEGDFEFRDTDGGVEITAYKGKSPVVVIPEKIGGKDVVAIAKYKVFANESTVRAVLLPASVETIKQTFVNNQCIEIIICEGVKHCMDYAIANCPKLHTLVLGDALEEIGESGISVCESLKEVYISPNVKTIDSAIAWSVFYSCSNLTIVGEEGSYIEQFAKEKNINFKAK